MRMVVLRNRKNRAWNAVRGEWREVSQVETMA